VRALIRAGFAFTSFFFAVALPNSLGRVAGLIGGITLPATLAYPCFMWLKVRKPTKYSGI
ncbi:hypothetical protein LINGRAHAP2_LOCUS4155, partial [Linum grandiflorum]